MDVEEAYFMILLLFSKQNGFNNILNYVLWNNK